MRGMGQADPLQAKPLADAPRSPPPPSSPGRPPQEEASKKRQVSDGEHATTNADKVVRPIYIKALNNVRATSKGNSSLTCQQYLECALNAGFNRAVMPFLLPGGRNNKPRYITSLDISNSASLQRAILFIDASSMPRSNMENSLRESFQLAAHVGPDIVMLQPSYDEQDLPQTVSAITNFLQQNKSAFLWILVPMSAESELYRSSGWRERTGKVEEGGGNAETTEKSQQDSFTKKLAPFIETWTFWKRLQTGCDYIPSMNACVLIEKQHIFEPKTSRKSVEALDGACFFDDECHEAEYCVNRWLGDSCDTIMVHAADLRTTTTTTTGTDRNSNLLKNKAKWSRDEAYIRIVQKLLGGNGHIVVNFDEISPKNAGSGDGSSSPLKNLPADAQTTDFSNEYSGIFILTRDLHADYARFSLSFPRDPPNMRVGYENEVQVPLQPMADNLADQVYEVFALENSPDNVDDIDKLIHILLEPSMDVSDGTAIQTTINQSVVPLKQLVIAQVFSFALLPECVNGIIVHWLIAPIACDKLETRLVDPQNGMLLLKWPLLFHNQEDCFKKERQLRYTDCMRRNLALQGVVPDETTRQIQRFLAGFESLMLNKVLEKSAENDCYSRLTTFVVDFSFPCSTVSHMQFDITEEQVAPFTATKTSKTLFLGDLPLWVKTITAIFNSCSSSLSNFAITNDGFLRDDLHLDGRLPGKLDLPVQLYRLLNLDRMLSKANSVRMLCMPIADYEKARHEKPELESWPSLWAMCVQKQQQRVLPKLRRVVIENSDDICCQKPKYAGDRKFELCAFPDLRPLVSSVAAPPNEIIVEVLDEDWFCEEKKEKCLVFAHASAATLSNTYVIIAPSDVHEHIHGLAFDYVCEDNPVEQAIAEILGAIKSEKSTRHRQQRLSVLNELMQQKRSNDNDEQFVPIVKKAIVELWVVDPSLVWADASRTRVFKTLSMLIGMLKRREICPLTERILIQAYAADVTWRWKIMQQLLPFFAANDADDEVLNAMRLHIVLGNGRSTFSSNVDEWLLAEEECNDGSKELLSGRYKFPRIYLTVLECDVRIGEACEDDDDVILDSEVAEQWAEAVERRMLRKIREFIRDAVNSCTCTHTRLGGVLSFDLYQSLKRVTFEFGFKLDLPWRVRKKKEVGESQMLKRIRLLLQGRAAEFEQRVVCEAFSTVLAKKDFDEKTFGWIDGSATPPVPVMPFSALRSIGRNIKVSVSETP